MLQVNSSADSPRERVSVSPKPTAWKREARSWKLSGRLRMIRRNKLILQGLKSVSSDLLSAKRCNVRDVCLRDGAKP